MLITGRDLKTKNEEQAQLFVTLNMRLTHKLDSIVISSPVHHKNRNVHTHNFVPIVEVTVNRYKFIQLKLYNT
jgi:hypothetical protein